MSERVKIKVEHNVERLPAIALRGLVLFPNNVVHFEVGRAKSIAAIEWAMANSSPIFLIAQRDMETEDPTTDDLYKHGVVAEIKQILRVSDELVKVLVEGKSRARLLAVESNEQMMVASIKPASVRGVKAEKSVEAEALVRSLKGLFEEYLTLNSRLSKDVVYNIVTNNDPVFLSEYIPANLLFKYQDKQAILDEGTLMGRLQKLVDLLKRENQVLAIEQDIHERVNDQMDKNQRDYYLREQMRVIAQELDEDEDTRFEADRYRQQMEALNLPQEAVEKLGKEIDRLSRMPGNSQEAAVIRTYLDTCLEMCIRDRIKENQPKFEVGDTVRVSVRIKEGERERIQAFEGTVIAKKHGGVAETFTVRRSSYGVGVERVFPVNSPFVEKVEVVRRGKVRRAKLFYLRSRTGKAAKVKEQI